MTACCDGRRYMGNREGSEILLTGPYSPFEALPIVESGAYKGLDLGTIFVQSMQEKMGPCQQLRL
jgi:hypothetical protein